MTKDNKIKDVHEAIEEARKRCKKQQLNLILSILEI